MAVNQTAKVLKAGAPALEREWDYDLAAVAIPANVKVIESFLLSADNNRDLLELAAKVYTSFGLIVLEDRLERMKDEESERALKTRARAREMYLRGHRYGLRLMDTYVDHFSDAFKKGREALKKKLAEVTKEQVHGLIWTAMPLASAINLGRDDVGLIALLPKVRAVIDRALELDGSYYNAAPHMMIGAMLGGVGKMFGGDAKKAREHFEKALSMTQRKFMLIHVMYAKTLAVQTQDRKLFETLLREVIKTPLSIYPEQKLANVTAKRKAKRLLARVEELF
ncbi:MAG: hypothetical protein KC503_22815 [Myxococcales bacterium]|nr:hypothetical protein [Myxococcales bacterium]